jgi:hypothetical protein
MRLEVWNFGLNRVASGMRFSIESAALRSGLLRQQFG